MDPKKELGRTVKKAGGTVYINTVHNKRIAKEARIDVIVSRCRSFQPFVEFMVQLTK